MLLLRSMLFVPGNNASRIRKAAASAADAVVLDLEDAVPRSEKDNARRIVRDSLSLFAARGAEVFVRVNASSTDLIDRDLEHAIGPGCRGIILPKAEARAEVLKVAERIGELEKESVDQTGSVSIVPLVESARGVLNAPEIGRHARVLALAFGALDYTRDMGVALTEARTELTYPRAFLPVAARALGVAALDAPWFDLNDERGLLRDTTLARDFGFTGKMVIHPRQLEIVNRIFSPSDQEVEQARKVIRAFEGAASGGRGATSLEGRMIDEASYAQAKDLLARAESIREKTRSKE